MWAPSVFELSDGLRRGENVLEITVRNTLGNIIPQTYGGEEPDQLPLCGLKSAPILLKVEGSE